MTIKTVDKMFSVPDERNVAIDFVPTALDEIIDRFLPTFDAYGIGAGPLRDNVRRRILFVKKKVR